MSEVANAPKPPPRVPWLDAARGGAVIAMVAYHLAWDISHFGLIETDVGLDPGWKLFAQTIAATFLAIAGLSLALAFRRGFDPRGFVKRLGLIGGAAALVSAGSYALFPDRFIFFGILHCIAVASIVALAFRAAPWGVTLAVAMVVLALPGFVRAEVFSAPALIWLGLGAREPVSNDFVPLLPWAGFLLAGLAFGQALGQAVGTVWPSHASGSGGPGWLRQLGRWSLPVYLIHQPLLFGVFHAAGALRLVTLQPEVKVFVQSCAIDCETAGGRDAVCLKACACAARGLRSLPLWPRVVANQVTGEDEAEMSRIGRACFTQADSAAPAAAKP